ncbi:hypothetical protein ACUXFH_002414 [Staphylococcus epidermidis]
MSVPEKDTARLRYTQTEKAIADPNTTSTAQYSWKDKMTYVRRLTNQQRQIWKNFKNI